MAHRVDCNNSRTAGIIVLRKSRRRSRPARGLILLIALGMLALFSLLAVTYVVSAGSSKVGSDATKVRSRGLNIAFEGTASKVANSFIRGTTDQSSPAYMKDLLGDIYGRNPITVNFGHVVVSPPLAGNPLWCTTVAGRFLKVSLNQATASGAGLSLNENEYNSRLITILEGPLAGQTFRILKYVGHVNHPDNSTTLDPNFAQNSGTLPWSSPGYMDLQGSDLDYSILIDLSEIHGETLTGQFTNALGALENRSLPVSQWLTNPSSLFFFNFPVGGYKCVINDAPFNSPGIGIEDVNSPTIGGFGTIDSRRVMSIPTLASGAKISPAYLTDYNYLNDTGYVVAPIPGIGAIRNLPTDIRLNGSSNEGIDVADYRDTWLAHQSVYWNTAVGAWVNNIIPSMHRPEVIHYIASVFGDPASLNAVQVDQLLKLIDASSSRIMSRGWSATGAIVNPNFRSDDPLYPRILPTFTWGSPPTAGQISTLQSYVASQIIGPWDFDNDGDGVNDSILTDSGMPATSGPDGKLLKPVMALLIEDLDGRLNVNLHGDRIQGRAAFAAAASLAGYQRLGELMSQGFGFGPADISLNGALNHVPALLTNPITTISGVDTTTFSFFDDRYGARRYSGRLRNMVQPFPITAFADVGLDRMPGRRAVGLPANDWASQVFEREVGSSVYRGSRSSVGAAFDVNGSFVFVPPVMDDANPTAPFVVGLPSDVEDDPYETAALSESSGDDPFSIADLEALLRRYDGDASSLPSRLKERLLQDPRNRRVAGDANSPYDVNKLLLNSEILRQLTTRSVELTHPNLGAAMVITNGTAATGINQSPRSFTEFIKMLHKQRYQNRSSPTPSLNDPELNTAAMGSLFPIDIANGLRIDLNRPFGNGRDYDGDGQVDDPQEIAYWIVNDPNNLNELESYLAYSGGVPTVGSIEGRYGREVALGGSLTRVRLSSRQAFARSLYCLAQLIIPRSYKFPAMAGLTDGTFAWYRVRAHAIAQWAVNVVDFRDSDSAMTRFEFDILPFGIGVMPTGGPTPPLAPASPPAKLAYWAPDYVHLAGTSVSKELVGVVWGMEMPELLLTESLALHDKRVRDTDADKEGKATTDPMSPDEDFDQYRFPLASLFLELYCSRTTTSPTNTIVPGAPSSLYTLASDGTMKLALGKMVDSGVTYGLQPVWRIGLSDHYPVGSSTPHPNATLQTTPAMMNKITHQVSSPVALAGSAAPGIPDAILGSGLYYDLTSTTATPPISSTFDRMIWFSGYDYTNTTPLVIPDLVGTPAQAKNRLYANRTAYGNNGLLLPGNSMPLLQGGSYLVVGPRTETPLGSLTKNSLTGDDWPNPLIKAGINKKYLVPVRSPSHQTVQLFPTSVTTTFLDGTAAESVWRTPTAPVNRIKPALGMVCATEPPNDPAVSDPNVIRPAEEWSDAFRTGVGINISLPTPEVGKYLWADKYRPIYRLNEDDKSRSDGLLGYGDNTPANYFPPDSWIKIKDSSPAPAVVTGQLPDRPFDYPDPAGSAPTLNPILNPTSGTGMYHSGTYQNVRVAYLQRLADPEFGYDPITNPYITVDWISIDLTVFNGECPAGADHTDIPKTIALQSRYKDGDIATATGKTSTPVPSQPAAGGAGGLTYHSPSTAQFRKTAVQPAPTASKRYPSYFMHQLGYASARTAANPGSSATTLGYLNVGYRVGSLATPVQSANDLANVYDGFGPPFTSTDPAYYGAIANMTSVAWLNRPFASPHELMLVPLTGPGQFGFYHSVFEDDNDQRHPFRFLPSFQTMNAWRVDHNISGTPGSGYDFDQIGAWAQPGSQTARSGGSFPTAAEADWPLLLEFVETRPPFVDAQKVYNPDPIIRTMNPNYPNAAPVNTRAINLADRFLDSRIRSDYFSPGTPEAFVGPTLRAPFNKTPSYRAAGKVNLNTITQERNVTSVARSSVLKGIEYNYLRGADRSVPATAANPNTDSIDPLTEQFMANRRGYPTGVISPFFASYSAVSIAPHLHPQFPTQFAGAYRSALTSNLAPHVEDPTARAKMRSKFGVESTLARSFNLANPNAASLAVSAAPADSMLFSPDSVNGVSGSSVPSTPQAIEDAKRNAFTRFQREMRLPNLVTNQSNVFAMWVTVSLYEYDPVTGFGNEYLDENGLPKRERMFYIIDRSIPVGYKPGENLNTDRTILLKRKLD